MNDYESLFNSANSALARIDSAAHEMKQQIREREAALSALADWVDIVTVKET